MRSWHLQHAVFASVCDRPLPNLGSAGSAVGITLNKAGHRQEQGINTNFHQLLRVLWVQLERTTPDSHHRKLPSSCTSQAPKLAPNLINSRHLWRNRLESNLQDRSTTLRHFLHHVDCSTCLPKDLDTTLQLVCAFWEYTLSHWVKKSLVNSKHCSKHMYILKTSEKIRKPSPEAAPRSSVPSILLVSHPARHANDSWTIASPSPRCSQVYKQIPAVEDPIKPHRNAKAYWNLHHTHETRWNSNFEVQEILSLSTFQEEKEDQQPFASVFETKRTWKSSKLHQMYMQPPSDLWPCMALPHINVASVGDIAPRPFVALDNFPCSGNVGNSFVLSVYKSLKSFWNINWIVNPSLYPANLASFLATVPCKSNSQVILRERSSSCMSPRLSVDGTWSGMQVSKADYGPSKWCTSRWLVESKPCGMEVNACERHSSDFKCLAAFHQFAWKIRSLIQWAE